MPNYFETFCATVALADCDHLGHMNVQHYFAAVSDGMFASMVKLGLGPSEIRERQMSFAVVRAETEFHQELYAGDVIVLESTIKKLGTKSASFHHKLMNVATDAVVMNTEFRCVLLHLQSRKGIEIPKDIRDAAIRVFSAESN